MGSAGARRRANTANIVVGAVVVLVAAVCVVAFFAMRGAGGSAPLRALVHDSTGAVHELPLSQDAELPVTTEHGTNIVVVENGSVYVHDADCDNQDCVHQGRIDSPGRQIICLPHKLWIEVVAQGSSGGAMDVSAAADGDLDVVSR